MDIDAEPEEEPASDPALPARPAPASGRGRTVAFGDLDRSAEPEEPRPAPASGRGRTVSFGHLDFADEAEEQAPEPAGELDIPSPSRRGGSTLSYGFGELDLPLEPEDEPALPSPSPNDGLPIVAAGLPVPAGVGLPSPAPAGLPVPSAGLPTPAGAGLPIRGGGAGLPTPAGGTGFPAPASPGLPSAAPDSMDFGESAFGGPISASIPAAGAGTVVGAELFDDAPPGYDDSRVGAAFQAPAPRPLPPNAPAPTTSAPPPALGDEIALDEVPASFSAGGAPAAFDPSDRSGNFQAVTEEDERSIELGEPAPSVGDEVDLTGAGTEIGDLTAEPAEVGKGREQAAESPGRKLKLKRYVIAILAAAAVGGGALALVPDFGPFGVNFIGDRLNAGSHENALADLRARARMELGRDTAGAAGKLLADAKAVQRSAPRHRPTAAYAAYLAFACGLRFGHRAVDDTYGKEMIAYAGSQPGDLLSLAAAAQDATSGQLARARQVVQTLAVRAPDDIDVAVLAAEIELAAKDTAKALEAWKRAAQIQKSARTLFGLARAQLATGDTASAEASAKAAMEASPAHVGGRTLLASLFWSSGREQQALELLTKATEDPEVRGAASDPELVEAQTLLGNIHLARSRMSAAEQAFAAALKLDPQAVNALIGNGELFYRAGRFSEALARFEAAVRADADSVAAKVGAAKTWLAQERMKEAKDLLKKLRETRSNDPLVNYWLGRAELALGNKKEAEAAYLDAVKIPENRPEVVDAYVALASLLSSLGRNDEATAKLAEATEKFPDLPALHKAKGEVALQTGRYEEARKEFGLALSEEEDLGTRFKLGVAFRRLRMFDEAAKTFDQVAAADKDYPGLPLEQGLLFEETGQNERALEMYADALRKAPNDVDLKLRVGSTQVMAGYATQAEPMLRDVLKVRPNSAEANHFLGRALLVRGTNLAEALRFLERAAEIDPNRAEYHLYLGWAANEAGQPGRADTALKRALELDQELGDAYWQRGVLLQKQGATLDALNDLKIALEKRPSRYEAYATMALCHQDQGDWAQAEEAWRKAIASNGKVPEWRYRLGKIYSSRGNRAGAATELDQAVTLAEAPDRSTPPWLFDAHFLLAEAMRATNNRDKALRSYRRFLELAPRDNAYRQDAEQAVEALGGGRPR
jgi:tetratricopeptide (TPR) repeat protein